MCERDAIEKKRAGERFRAAFKSIAKDPKNPDRFLGLFKTGLALLIEWDVLMQELPCRTLILHLKKRSVSSLA